LKKREEKQKPEWDWNAIGADFELFPQKNYLAKLRAIWRRIYKHDEL